MVTTIAILLLMVGLSTLSLYGAWVVIPYRQRFKNSSHRFLFTWVVMSLSLKASVILGLAVFGLLFTL